MSKYSSVDSILRARTEAFATELAVLVRRSALETVQAALGAGVTRRGPGRPRKVSAAARRSPGRPAKAGRRGKRTSAQVEEMGSRLLAYVKAKPGQSIEQIGKAMRQPTKVLKLPVTKLVEKRSLKTKGQKRGTRYFAV